MNIQTMTEFEKWIKKQDKVYVYGAGNIGKKVLSKLERLDALDKVKGILVTHIDAEEELLGIKIKNFCKNEIDTEAGIIVAVSGLYRNEISSFLKQQGIECFITLSDGFEHQLHLDQMVMIKQELWEKVISLSQSDHSNKQQSDILFLSPPYWDTYSPFSAVPCLVAKLRQEGFLAEQYDMGIYCVHHMIRKKHKQILKNLLSAKYYEKEIKIYEKNPYQNYEQYLEGMDYLQGETFDIEKIKHRYKELNAVQRRVLDAFYSQIYRSDLSDIDFDNCECIDREIECWSPINLLESLLETKAGSALMNIPKVVGISVTSTVQFIPGCVLAALIRKCRPDVKIIMGGSCADLFINSTYNHKSDIKKYFDYLIIGEGETAIVELMRYINGSGNLEDVPNMAIVDDSGKIELTKQIVEDVDELPAPDYDGLDMSLYLAPELVLPYQTSRGCHYGQCAFCNHDEKYRHNYRSKTMEKVVAELLAMSKKYNTNYFQFVDEAIRPDCFQQMVEKMDKYGEFKQMKWFYYSRVSMQYNEEILKKAHENGCEMVMFGVESLNQRLLKFIKKGISEKTSRHCLELFHKCGIKTYAWLMCNLPTETLEEARADLAEVKKLKMFIDAFSVGPFWLVRNTDMYKNPEKYNIVSIDEHNPWNFQSHKNGEIINKKDMMDFYAKEYLQYQRECCGTGNRYTVFFE